jgi:hypothetical protein
VSEEGERDPEEALSPWQSIGRLVHHTIHILFYMVLHLLIRLTLKCTGQEHEWWAPVALTGTGVMFLISFFVIGGSELIGDCWDAVKGLRRRLRER